MAPPQVQLPANPVTPNWQAMAGVQSLPASSSSGSANDSDSITSMIQQAGLMPQAPTASPYIKGQSALPEAKVHAPNLGVTNQDTNRAPMTNQSSSIIQARRQNRFANITNAVNQFSNIAQQKKYDDLKTDIKNLSSYQTNIAEAQQVLQQPNITPEIKAQAEQSLKDNQAKQDALLKDDKRRKEIGKAFDINFTNPADNGPEVKIGQQAIQESKFNDINRLGDNSAADKAVGDHLSKSPEGGGQTVPMSSMGPQGSQPQIGAERAGPAGKPATSTRGPGASYGQQFSSAIPSKINANPLYEQQLKQQEAQQKYVAQYIIPKMIDQATRTQNTKMLSDAKLRGDVIAAEERSYNAQVSRLSEQDRARIAANASIQRQGMANAQSARNAQLRSDTALKLGGILDAKGNIIPGVQGWKADAARNAALMSFTNEVDKTTANNTVIQKQNESIEQSARTRGSYTPEETRQLEDNKATISLNNMHVQEMIDNRQKLAAKMFGTPVGNPTDNTRGYMQNGQPQSTTRQPGTSGAAVATDQSSLTRGFGDTSQAARASGPVVPIGSVNGPADDTAAAATAEATALEQSDSWLKSASQFLNEEDLEYDSTYVDQQ